MGATTSTVRQAVSRMAVPTVMAAVFAGFAAAGGAAPALAIPGRGVDVALQGPSSDVPVGPNDPRCIVMPTVPQCQGGPYAPPGPVGAPGAPALPTGPLDPACMTNPADAACAGSPYLPPSAPPPVIAPPPMASGMPGQI